MSGPLRDPEAYRVFQTKRPILHGYLLDPDIQAVLSRLEEHGSVSLVDPFRMLVLKQLLLSTGQIGEVWELGVFKGGTALLLHRIMSRASGERAALRLFDTFAGMPPSDPLRDLHREGDFSDTSLSEVKSLIGCDGFVDFRAGLVPETFSGLHDSQLRFAHIDLDIYAPIAAAIAFIFPRLLPGGIMLFDDYGFNTCPGARAAIEEAFADAKVPIVALPSGQAFVIKR